MSVVLRHCEFHFYEELNRFLSPERCKRGFAHAFKGTPAGKDPIEALGVPHTEVDLILVDSVSVTFAHRLRGGERGAVYPVFERSNSPMPVACVRVRCASRASCSTSTWAGSRPTCACWVSIV